MSYARLVPFVVGFLFVAGCGSSGGTAAPVGAGNSPAASTSKLTPQELATQADVPVYPGALFPNNETKPPSTGQDGKTHTYLVMSTGDAPEKVAAFYVKTGKYAETKTKDGIMVQGMSPKGNLVLIDVTASGGLTTISVRSVPG